MDKTADIVIIGGGIIGASIAYYLAAMGAGRIVLLEKGSLGEGSTAKCAGGIRTQFSTDINIRFSLQSLQTWNHFQEIFGVPLDFKKVGYLFLASSEDEWSLFKAGCRLQRDYRVPVELLSPSEIGDRWPFLRIDDLVGGTFCGWDGYAGPYEALTGFAKGARRAGVRICEGIEVHSIFHEKGRVTGVCSPEGDISCPVVVNAAGPFAERVGRMAGIHVPVKPYRRQLFFTAPFSRIPDPLPLVIDFHRGWYFRREVKGFLISGPKDDFPSFNTSVDFAAMAETADNAVYRVPVLETAQISHGWAGLYEVSPDNHAILGETPELKGFFLANGFSGHGFQHSPAVGEVMAQLIMGQMPAIDISVLAVERFSTGKLIREPLIAFKE
jgi:sarcosine oxidase, subunit beta